MRYERLEVAGITVECPTDCGNAPKKLVLRDFLIARAANQEEFLLGQLSDQVVWERAGEPPIRGKEAVLQLLRDEQLYAADELLIRSVITHGWIASADGIIRKGEQRTAFSEVYLFSQAGKAGKIKEIRTYLIPLPPKSI